MNAVAVAKPVYLLDHDWEQEPYRLALLEHHADPTSVRRLQATGVGAGWRCLEVGAGLLDELREAGLGDTSADFRVDVVEGGTPLAQWEQVSSQALTEELLSAGTTTAEQIEQQLARLENPEYRGYGFTWIGARGRRA